MTAKKKVLLIGWNPDSTDYSKWPELNHEKLSSALEASRSSLNAQGYDASWCFLADNVLLSSQVEQEELDIRALKALQRQGQKF